jgi:hypothetical protein
MSLSTDVLSRATPTRLLYRAGRWTLELTRLEAVDRDVYQPRLTRLEGTDSILAALRRSEDGQVLVSSATQLMRGPRGDEDRAFEVSEGDWVPTAEHGHAPRQNGATDPNVVDDAVRAVAELRAELAVLRASHARLRERVIALEAAQIGLPAGQLRAPRGSRSQRRRSEPPQPGVAPGFSEPERKPEPLANVAFDATQASAPLAPAAPVVQPPAAAAATPAADAAAAPPTFEELAKSLAGEQLPPVLTIPSLPSVSECLATLMGSAPDLQRIPEKPFEALDRPHGCKLLDDEGAERGMIVMDLRAAVLLGAALLALPRDEALRQLSENDPSEDALLAMSEICNNLTGPVNAVKGNAHVRSTALESVEVSALKRPRARLDLAIEGGVLILAMY